MLRLKQHRPPREIRCSADVLKWVGFVVLCLGSFSAAVLQQGMMSLDQYTSQTLYEALANDSDLFGLATAASILTLLSALALPIYAKLLWEGWKHTHDQGRYLLRLVVCALVSEIPYDLVNSGKVLDLQHQGPLWALVFAAVMLAVLRQLAAKRSAGWVLLKILVVVAACLWTVLLQSYLGVLTVLLVAVFCLLEKHRAAMVLVGVVLCTLQFPAPFSMFLIYWYDGKPGKTPRMLFYYLYPAQLLLFYCLGRVL